VGVLYAFETSENYMLRFPSLPQNCDDNKLVISQKIKNLVILGF
jgi:hypothetical protein